MIRQFLRSLRHNWCVFKYGPYLDLFRPCREPGCWCGQGLVCRHCGYVVACHVND